ncbi:histone-lysine N-methyltransferase [Elysia marginata]|uniref:Histone-lysine N-methyltransferase n=1 Tax=Elysia marginata TaxID=1093978 RepID=A0AAV4FR36_9GAST|nr:histone-lysine N-methyltransferase [Elysia marginata]
MARLRFPGRPGYRFDRIGVRYGADEARQTTDPSLAVVASIHKGLQRFRDLFGDSDEDEEFQGFLVADVKNAERQLFKYEQAEQDFLARQAEKEERDKQARSQAALVSFAAATGAVQLEGQGVGRHGFGKTFKQILDTGLVQNYTSSVKSSSAGRKRKPSAHVAGEENTMGAFLQQNNKPVRERVTSLKHVKLKRLTHFVDGQVVFRRPVGRPRKNFKHPGTIEDLSFVNGESAVLSQGPRSSSKYTSAAQHLLAKAAKLHHSNSASLTSTSCNKVRKFVLPTKSSRSSRVIKPNKRFLEENSMHAAIVAPSATGGTGTEDEHFTSQLRPMLSMLPTSTSLPSSSGDAPLRKSIFGIEVGEDKPGSLGASLASGSSAFPSSPFLHHSPGGLASLSPFNLNREKGFPSFSAAPQPSGTTSFTDKSQWESSSSDMKPLGALDQPLIVEGKRPRKPSLIMRMKLVEDDPEDEIRLQQSLLADSTSPPKPLGLSSALINSSPVAPSAILNVPDSQTESPIPAESASSSTQATHGYGTTKSLIAPAKLFTGSASASSSSKFSSSRRHKLKPGLLPTQQTVVLRQAKLQLNRAALNRSKAALARSLKATLKREARMERRKRFSQRKLRKSVNSENMSALEGAEASAASGLLSLSGSAAVPALSPSASAKLSQLSPFSLQTSGAMVEKSKQGLFQGMEGSNKADVKVEPLGSPALTPTSTSSTVPAANLAEPAPASDSKLSTTESCGKKGGRVRKAKKEPVFDNDSDPAEFWGELDEGELDEYFESIVSERDLLKEYKVGDKNQDCLVCKSKCRIKANRKLPILPLCKPCKKAYFFQLSKGPTPTRGRKCSSKNQPDRCGPDNPRSDLNHCPSCKYRRFCGVLRKARKLGVEAKLWTKGFLSAKEKERKFKSANQTVKWKDFIRKGPKKVKLSSSEPESDCESSPKKKARRKSIGDFSGSEGTFTPGKAAQRKRHRSLSSTGSDFARQQDIIQSKHLDQPLSVDVGDTSGSFNSSSDDSEEERKPRQRLKSLEKKHRQSSVKKERKSSLSSPLPMKENKASIDLKEEDWLEEDGIHPGEEARGNGELQRMKKSSKRDQNRIRYLKFRKRDRRLRCRKCKGCLTPECGNCVSCSHSMCLNLRKVRQATDAFIDPKSPEEFRRRDNNDDDNNGGHSRSRMGNGSHASSQRSKMSGQSNGEGGGGGEINGRDGDGAQDAEDADSEMYTDSDSNDDEGRSQPYQEQQVKRGLDMDGSQVAINYQQRRAAGAFSGSPGAGLLSKLPRQVSATVQLALTDNRLGRGLAKKIAAAEAAFVGKMKKKKAKKQEAFKLKPVDTETAYSVDVPLKKHLIKADYQEEYDVETAWLQGYALTVTGPSCVRTLCFLCGSAGKHQMVFCIVCCQSFHNFCLEEEERPEEVFQEPGSKELQQGDLSICGGDDEGEEGGQGQHHSSSNSSAVTQHRGSTSSGTLSWCCRRCQFCHVCGQQNGLLKEEYDVETAWLQGYALTVTGPSCVRTLCFLCGSAGKHQMIFCIVCCQSFHNFCLEEEERPEEVFQEQGSKELQQGDLSTCGGDDEGEEGGQGQHHSSSNSSAVTQHRGSTSSGTLSWCCRRCQFCHVCGQQNGLLKSWSRRPKPKNVEGSKTVTVKEVGRPGADGQPSNDLPQTVTINLDNGDSTSGDDPLAQNRQTTAALSTGATLTESPVPSVSSHSLNVEGGGSNSGNREIVPAINQNTILKEKFGKDISSPLPLSFSSNVETDSCGHVGSQNSVQTTSALLEQKSDNSREERTNNRPVNDVIVCLDSDEETQCEAAAGLSVSFEASGKDDTHGKDGDFPTDFKAVEKKIGAGSYSTVEEFSEDMVRIIQAMLLKNQNYPSRRKQANSVRSIFIKQMERIFPWFNVNTCKLWEHNKGLPEGMLRDAVLPPSDDHTYAQWLERQILPMNPQPSPFKKNSTPQRRSSEEETPTGQEASVGESLLSPDLPQASDDTRVCLLCGGVGDDKPDVSVKLVCYGEVTL